MSGAGNLQNDMTQLDSDVPNFFGFKRVEERFQRMRDRPNRKWYMLYPEDRFKVNWDLFVALILIVTCSITPVTLAFYEEESVGIAIFNNIINILFGIDIIIIFITATYNDDFVLIDDLPMIAK